MTLILPTALILNWAAKHSKAQERVRQSAEHWAQSLPELCRYRSFRDNTQATDQDEYYLHDSLNRLTDRLFGSLNAGRTSISNAAETERFVLDGLGNWDQYDREAGGVVKLDQSRGHSKANELTAISRTIGSNWTDPAHDKNGNMTTLPKPLSPTGAYTAVYDAWNRLTQIKDGPAVVATYRYDGLHRRVKKDASGQSRHYYHSHDGQVLEERLGASPNSANPRKRYVWDPGYTDCLIKRDRDSDGNGSLDERLYAH